MIPAHIARLNTDGSTDTSFDIGPGANNTARAIAILPDGKVVAGGDFSTVDWVPQTRLTVRNPDGSLADGFAIAANNTVYDIITSTDGKAILAGDFTTLGGETRTRAGRLSSDLTVGAAFAPSFNNTVYAAAGQEDGKVIFGGVFLTVNGGSYPRLCRLYNDEAQSNLSVLSSSAVLWERSGSSPETHRVLFELSTDGGESWSSLGAGVPVDGGWTLTGLSLSGDGIIRGRAYPHSVSSEGVIQDTVSFDFVPEIQVEQPEGNALIDAVSTSDFGDVQVGSSLSFTYYIRNIGLANLVLTTPTQVAISGTNADQWSLVAQPATPVAPGSASTFTLTFTPTTPGTKTALLTILSDDADEGTFTVNLSAVATPGPGSRDTTFQPTVNNAVYAIAPDIFTKVDVGGDFTSLNGTTRNRFGRLNDNGTTDTSVTGTGANNTVRCIAALPDGSMILGGYFSTINGTTRRRLAKVSSTGVLDATFNPNVTAPTGSYVSNVDVASDGRILVAGFFSTIGGFSRPNVAVLASNGNVDTSFNPPSTAFGGSLRTAAVFDNEGRILVASSSNGLTRCLANGTLDTSFNTTGVVAANNIITSIAVTPTGKIYVAGNFTTINGESRDRIALLNEDGTVDSFTCSVSAQVNSISLQADGSLVIGGFFSTVAGDAAPYVARVLPDGSNDDTFATGVTSLGIFSAATLQADGKYLMSGSFTIEGTPSVRLARLVNSPSSDELSLLSASEALWLRSGSCPELSFVKFEYSQDGGSTWTTLADGTRTSGGWNATGVSLPVSGLLRAVGRVPSGISSGLVTTQIPFSGLAVPDIQVEQPANTIISDNGSRSFPGRLVGQSADLTFTIRNTGGAMLSSIVAISSNPSEFTIISAPAASLAAGATTTMTVRFQPSTIGARSSTLSITSNVAGGKSPYLIALSGNGITTPLVTTLSAQSITSTTALLRGNFTARDDSASAYFQYRTSSADPWTNVPVSPIAVPGGFTTELLTQGLTGLTPADTYQFRAVIYNSVTGSGAPVYGAILNFTTSP